MAQGGWQVWVWEVAQTSWRTGNEALDVKELEASSAWAQGKVQEWMISFYRQSLYCCASASLLLPQVVSSHQMRADASEFPRYYLLWSGNSWVPSVSWATQVVCRLPFSWVSFAVVPCWREQKGWCCLLRCSDFCSYLQQLCTISRRARWYREWL